MNSIWLNAIVFRLPLVASVIFLTGCDTGLTVSQRQIEFGKTLVGSSSPSVGVHWTNNTNETYTIHMWEAVQAPFSATYPASGTINSGASTGAATVTFSPVAIGTATSKVRPKTAPHSSESARLRGEGVMLIVEGVGLAVQNIAASSEIDFGRKQINTAPPKTQTLVFTNGTTSAINLTTTVTGGAPVFGSQSTTVTIPALDTTATPPTLGRVTVTLTFAPTAEGEQFGAIVFVGPNHKVGVTVKGTGVRATEPESD